MKTLCELMALEVLPTVRALIAKRLVETHGLSQQVAADRLGTTQPAISQYKRDVRGYKTSIIMEDDRLVSMIDSISKRLASSEIGQQEASIEFCGICRRMRESGAACELHRKINPSLQSCSICEKLQC